MKKSLLILCAAVVALVSCKKELAPADQGVGEPVQVVFNLSATHPDGAATKAVKTGWETGDVVFVFFSKQIAPSYLEMKWNGTEWVNTQKDLSFKVEEAGMMTAVYLPFGSDATVSAADGSYKFSKTYLSYYLTAKLKYDVTEGEISGTFEMKIPDGYVQFFRNDASADASTAIELREPHMTPQGIASIDADGTIRHTSIAQGAPLPGYVYDKEVKGSEEKKGWLFSGILEAGARNTEANYIFTLVEGGWNGSYSRKFFLSRTLYRGDQDGRALKLPVSGWTEITDYKPIDLGCDVNGRRIYWSNRNLGATADTGEDSYGNYYAWGETEPKEEYTWDTYFDTTDGGTTFTKYALDKKTVLESGNDAARVETEGIWRMPTDAEWEALCNTTNFTWTWDGDNKGRKVTSNIEGYGGSDGPYIFLPAAGYWYGTDFLEDGSYGDYWSSSLVEGFSEGYSGYAGDVHFDSEGNYKDYGSRLYGISVRPVSE